MILLVILAAALLALFAACFAIVRLGERERIGAADVVVVLGCKVHGDGAPSQMLAGRLERA